MRDLAPRAHSEKELRELRSGDVKVPPVDEKKKLKSAEDVVLPVEENLSEFHIEWLMLVRRHLLPSRLSLVELHSNRSFPTLPQF